MNTHAKTFFGSLAVLAVGSVAFATIADANGWGRGDRGGFGRGFGSGAMMGELFDEVDANGDGQVSREEATSFAAGRLQAFDGDGDAGLSLEEFEGLWLERTRPVMVRAYQFLDSDGDASINEEEIQLPVERAFERIDRDGDDVVAREDIRGDSGRHRQRNHDDS